MASYEINLGVLVLVNGLLYIVQWRQAKRTGRNADTKIEESSQEPSNEAQSKSFLYTYLVAYLLAVAADWLQGPHIYAIYRYDKQLEETTTAALYATGFISGAVSSAFVGQLADAFGRRAACMVYCFSYVLCCLSMLSDDLAILFLGRVCGGIGTTLLYTSFESWMMTEYYRRDMEAAGLSTATVFGTQTTLNSIVAILSGVVGELLISATGSRKSPFMLAGLAAILAAAWMALYWVRRCYISFADADTTETENVGKADEGKTTTSLGEFLAAVKTIWQDKHIFALTTASSIFEAMMYLFVFFWSAAITSPRLASGTTEDPPFGTIFSCFMCAMMAGAQLFSFLSKHCETSKAASILEFAMTLASLALVTTVLSHNETYTFWAFCVIELCIGLYFPSMSFLKGNLIEDGSRAKLYSLMRLPLNILVVLTHALAEEGDHHRQNVFLSFGSGVIIAFVIVRRFIE